MSRYVIPGPLRPVDAESLTAIATDITLTAAKYAKGGNISNFALLSVTDTNELLVTISDPDTSLPADGSEGILWKKDYGPFPFHGDMSQVLIRKSGASDCTFNVNYFVA